MRKKWIILLAGFTLLLTNAAFQSGSASAAGCSETTKFVEEYNTNPSIGSTNYFGNEGSAYNYNHLPICSGGATAESFFMRLSPDYLNYVETGSYQKPTDSSSHTHDWGEWHYYPAPIQLNLYDSQAGLLTTGTTYSFRLQNGTSTSWDLYVAHTSSPGSSWNHVANTGNLAAFAGIPESEMARTGTANADDNVSFLQEQDTFLGSWTGWQHLGCDNSQRSILDWAVVKLDDSDWYMIHQAPQPGQC